MKSMLYTVLFCIAIFVMTVAALTIAYIGIPVVTFYSPFVYVIAFFLLYHFLVRPLSEKISGRRMLLLSVSVVAVAAVLTQSAKIVITPQWSFSVTTDKPTYMFGEEIGITVCLRNDGFITHSFQSGLSEPVVVLIEYQYSKNPTVTSQVWYSSTFYPENPTEFSVESHQCLERNFVWNQTTKHTHGKEIEPGIYQIKAFIPSAGSKILGTNYLFSNYTIINITSP